MSAPDDQRFGIRREQLARQVDVARSVEVADGDPDELERGSCAVGELVAVLAAAARRPGSPRPRRPAARRAVVGSRSFGSLVVRRTRSERNVRRPRHRASRSSMVSPRTITRARSVAHGDDRRARHVVVVARQREAVRARRGHREQVAGRDVAGQVLGVDDDVAGLAVLADHAHERGRGGAAARGDAGGELRAVQGGAGVVAHAAVDAHIQALRAARRVRPAWSFRLRRASRRPGRRSPGRVRTRGSASGCRAPRTRARRRPRSRRRDPRWASGRRPRCRRCRNRRRGSGRGSSPPSSRAACSSTSRAADSRKPAVPKICEPMWQCSPTNCSPASLADARDERRGFVEGEAELLVLVRRREEVVGLGVHAAVDAHEHGLGRRRARSTIGGEPLDLDRAVDHDRADADLDGALELGHALVVAVEAEPRRDRRPRRARQRARRRCRRRPRGLRR